MSISVQSHLDRAASWLKMGQPVIVAKRNPDWSPAMPGREFLFPRNWQSIGPDDCDLSAYEEGDALIAPCGWTFDVIDIDTKLGEGVSRASVPPEIETFGEHQTPSGGYHLFVKRLGYSKNNKLTFSGVHIGDYLAGTDAGAGRAFVYLPGTRRQRLEYAGKGYRVVREVDLEKLIDSYPDPILESVVMRCGSSKTGDVGRMPATGEEAREFIESFRRQERQCAYGREVLNSLLAQRVPIGTRHNWYVRSMLRVVELVKTGCCTVEDIRMLDDRLAQVMPEGGTRPSDVLRYAIANTKVVRGTGCIKHRYAEPTIIDWSDPAVKEREASLGLVDWPSLWSAYDNEGATLDVVKGMVQEGSTICIFAESGKGKTLLAREWAVKLARGEMLMGQQRPPMVVMYVDQEVAPLAMAKTYDDMGYGYEDDMSNLRYYSLGQWKPLNTQEGADQIIEEIIRIGAQVVFLDTLGKFFHGSENDAEPFLEMNRMFGVRARRLGVTLIKIDHTGKDPAKGARGNSAKISDLDTEYHLSVPKAPSFGEPAEVLMKRTKDRLNYGEATVTFLRHVDPLRHEWVQTKADDYMSYQIEVVLDRMDNLDIPLDMGRAKVLKVLQANGGGVGTTLLAAAIKERKVRSLMAETCPGTGLGSAKILNLETARGQHPQREAL